MKLTWHIVLKDLRRARWLIAVWLGWNLLPVIAGAMVLAGGEDPFDSIGLFKSGPVPLLNVGSVCLVAFLTAWVIHEDNVVRTDLPWVVLPISGLRLLAAKVIFLVLTLWAAPLLFLVPWWVINEFAASDVLSALGDQSVVVLPAMLASLVLATLTDSLSRWALVGFVVYLGMMALAGVAASTIRADGQPLPEGVADSRMMIFALILLLGSVAAVIHQFSNRRLRLSLVVAGIGVGTATLVAVAWPWNVLRAPTRLPTNPPVRTDVALDWDQPVVGPTWTRTGDELQPRLRLTVRARVQGLAKDEFWTGQLVEIQFIWGDGKELNLALSDSQLRSGRLTRIGRFVREAQSSGEPFADVDHVELTTMVTIDEAWLEKFAQAAPAVRIAVEGKLFRGEVVADLPLEAGATGGSGPHRIKVFESTRTAPRTQSVRRLFATTATNTLVVPQERWDPKLFGPQPHFGPQGILVYNSSADRALEALGRQGIIQSVRGAKRSYAGVEFLTQTQELGPPRGRLQRIPGGETLESVSDRWLDHARLIWVRTDQVGVLDSVIVTDAITRSGSFVKRPDFSPIGPPETVVFPAASDGSMQMPPREGSGLD